MPQIVLGENGQWLEVPTPEEIEQLKFELIKKSDPAFAKFLERERDAHAGRSNSDQ